MAPTSRVAYFDLSLVRHAADKCYKESGIRDPIKEIQVMELYDPYSIIGAMQIEQLGFCSPGTALRLERDGYWNWRTGAVSVNPSGGTLCTNPIAITGLVRAIDAANQVMNTAGEMQVPGVHNALSSAAGGIAQFFNCTLFGAEPCTL